MRNVVFGLVVLAGCSRPKAAPLVEPEASPPASVASDAAPPKATGACVVDPTGSTVIPDSARATQIRMAAAGSKALVTFWETKKSNEGPDIESAFGYVFDATSSSLGSKTKFQENSVGDEPVSSATPVVIGGDVSAISCEWAAPAGRYACTRAKPGEKPITLFGFSGIPNGGPQKPDIAAVVKGDDALVAVPVGGDLRLFSASVSSKTKASPFGLDMAPGQPPDALGAVLSDDGAVFVYRHNGAVRARRAGFDQKWRGGPVDLSAKGMLVGAPAVASESGRVVALYSQRAKPSDPWKIAVAELTAAGEVKRSDLATGTEEAQGPGIAKAADPACFHVSWVEGQGKTTRTKLARACNGAVLPSSVTTLSSAGVEGGRAYLATDPSSPQSLFAVWQEIPAGKPAELRVARLTCK